jgi:hypothetical protein
MLKKNHIYKLYSEDIAIAKQDYFFIYTLAMPGDFGKMPKYASSRQTKVTVLWFVKCTN